MSKHQEEEVCRKFFEKVWPSLAHPVALATFDCRSDGAISPCCVPFGPKGEGGLDDATNAAKMAAGASGRQTAKTDLGLLQ